jgi:hypothetical protein
MATFTDFYIPSRTPNKTWRVYVYKPPGRPAYVNACEGVSEGGRFTHVIDAGVNGDRSIKVNISGRATLRAVIEAGQEILRQMADNGYITADAVDENIPKLVK